MISGFNGEAFTRAGSTVTGRRFAKSARALRICSSHARVARGLHSVPAGATHRTQECRVSSARQFDVFFSQRQTIPVKRVAAYGDWSYVKVYPSRAFDCSEHFDRFGDDFGASPSPGNNAILAFAATPSLPSWVSLRHASG
jgi:hypothetical protein